MNSKTTITMVLLLAAIAVTGTVMGTQYVNAWHRGHYHGHGGYGMAMATSYGHHHGHGGYGMAMATSTGGSDGYSSGGSGGGY